MRAILQELVYDAPVGGAVWPFDRGYIRPPHFHGQVELLLIRRGTATVQVGARSERLRAGQLCWIWPCLPHVMSAFSDDFDMWVVELDADVVAARWRRDGDTDSPFEGVAALAARLAGRTVITLPPLAARRLDELCAGVWAATAEGDVRHQLRALAGEALQSTLAAIPDRPARPTTGGGPSLADQAWRLLLSSPLLDRPQVAATLGVSEGFLSRSFGRDLGVSFVEHRARARVAHFLELAQGRARNLLDAALAAGFGSYSQFHRVFTRVAGARPADYFSRGRQHRELLVAGDGDRPQLAGIHALPDRSRQRANLGHA